MPRRLTTRVSGAAAFLPGGDVLFVSDRAGEDADTDDTGPERAQLWRLPRGGGEARELTALPGGVSSIVAIAADAQRIVLAAELMHGADSLDDDAQRRAMRRRRKVAAILHETYPVRYWDHDLGPTEPHLLALDLTGEGERPLDVAAAARAAERVTAADGPSPNPAEATPYPEHLPAPQDLTPHPGRAADIQGAVLTPDGATLIASIQIPRERAGCAALAADDTRTGERRMLFAQPGIHFESPQLRGPGRRGAHGTTPIARRTRRGGRRERSCAPDDTDRSQDPAPREARAIQTRQGTPNDATARSSAPPPQRERGLG